MSSKKRPASRNARTSRPKRPAAPARRARRASRRASTASSRTPLAPVAALGVMTLTLLVLITWAVTLPLPRAHGQGAAGGGGGGGQYHLKMKNYDVIAKDKATAEKNGRELAESAKLFEDLFGEPPPRGQVTISAGAPGAGGFGGMAGGATKGGAKWTLPWMENPFGAAGGGGGGAGGQLPGGGTVPQGLGGGNLASSMNPLTHEAAHLQFLHLVNPKTSAAVQKGFTGYGSYLPDWIDEAVAVMHESEPSKQNRRNQMKQNLGSRIPFETFFTMAHPFMNGQGGLNIPGAPGGAIPGGGEMPPMNPSDPRFQKGIVFYAQCLSVLEFFLAEANKDFVRHLVASYQKGVDTEQAIATANDGLLKKGKKKKRRRGKKGLIPDGKGDPLPDKLGALEQAWVAWVKKSY